MSTQVSPHFDLEEFDQDAPIPADCVPILRLFCIDILEPIRAWLNRPMEITSGYRSPEHNQEIHGSPTSEHVYTTEYCASDFVFNTTAPTSVSIRACYDWIRQNPRLPFHQVILEHSANGTSIIHISMNLTKWGVRQALEGATYNASAYSTHDVTSFGGPSLNQENVNGSGTGNSEVV